MSDLFPVETTLSPFEQWKKEFDIRTAESDSHSELYSDHLDKWSAWVGELDEDGIADKLGTGETEGEALRNLCTWFPIPTYEEWITKGGGHDKSC